MSFVQSTVSILKSFKGNLSKKKEPKTVLLPTFTKILRQEVTGVMVTGVIKYTTYCRI